MRLNIAQQQVDELTQVNAPELIIPPYNQSRFIAQVDRLNEILNMPDYNREIYQRFGKNIFAFALLFPHMSYLWAEKKEEYEYQASHSRYVPMPLLQDRLDALVGLRAAFPGSSGFGITSPEWDIHIPRQLGTSLLSGFPNSMASWYFYMRVFMPEVEIEQSKVDQASEIVINSITHYNDKPLALNDPHTTLAFAILFRELLVNEGLSQSLLHILSRQLLTVNQFASGAYWEILLAITILENNIDIFKDGVFYPLFNDASSGSQIPNQLVIYS